MEKIRRNKKQILVHLNSWVETFNPECILYDVNRIEEEEEEELHNRYSFMKKLRNKLKYNRCTKEDYKEILFHIEQINYDEIRIKLL